MAGLEDTFRSAAPGGSIAKPLMLAYSPYSPRVLCLEGVVQVPPRPRGRNQLLTKGRVVCSADWVDCWTNYRRVAWETWSIPG